MLRISSFIATVAQTSKAASCCLAIRAKTTFVPPSEPWDLTRTETGPTKRKWEFYNNTVWPPHCTVGEEHKPKTAEVFHMRENIKYSPDKMWFICHMIRGLSIDEALKQLSFTPRKGAMIAREVLQEAQIKAVRDHNIEFKSNLWVAEAFSEKSMVIKGFRRHARGRHGNVQYVFSNLFVRLEEGSPPPYATRDARLDGWQRMEAYINWMRNRKIEMSW